MRAQNCTIYFLKKNYNSFRIHLIYSLVSFYLSLKLKIKQPRAVVDGGSEGFGSKPNIFFEFSNPHQIADFKIRTSC